MEYKYLGDRLTSHQYKGQLCRAVRIKGKCIRGKNSNMLVTFQDGSTAVVLARLLRKIKPGTGGTEQYNTYDKYYSKMQVRFEERNAKLHCWQPDQHRD
jgi:hypothetical protein